MCDIWKDSTKAEISIRELERYLDDIEKLSVQWVVFSGGEPLMHSDLFRFCGLLRPLRIRTTVLSTGLLLERNAQRIVDHVNDVIVSLDGPPGTHDRIRRVEGAFAKLEKGVRAIHAIDSSFPISARCTVQRGNHACLRETACAAKALGLSSISFLAADLTSEAFNRAGGWDAAHQQRIALDESQIHVLEQQLDLLSAEWSGTGFVVESREKLQRIGLHYRSHLGLCEPVAPGCNAPWVSAVLEANGTVRPCFFHRPIGTVNGISLFQVLNGPEAVQFRRDLDISSNPICRRCVCSLNWQPTGTKLLGAESDPLSLPPPRPAYYDSSLNAWVLSRYADVLSALHETRLRPVDSRAEALPEKAEIDAQRQLRIETQAALSHQSIKSWQPRFAAVASACMETLRSSARVDIVKQFAEPWCLSAALMVTQADAQDAHLLKDLAGTVSIATADPMNESLRHSAKAASAELAKRLASSPIPMSGPAFVALTQTLPRFLANAWLTLLRNPREFDRLRNEPSLMPFAIEELLRYAGLAHTIYRLASATLHLAGITVDRGARVVLKLSSANRDPAQFPQPDLLDFSRRLGPQLALGAGLHSCAGGSLIRMLSGIATAAFVENVTGGDIASPLEWHGGSGFRSLKSLYVHLRARK